MGETKPKSLWLPERMEAGARESKLELVWKRRHTVIVFGAFAVIVVAGLLVPALYPDRFEVYLWLGVLILLAVSFVAAGHGITGRVLGCLIDSRNRMSLARLQTILWTLLVLSAFLAGAMIRIRAGVPDPISIGIPEQLWIVMGISVTSLVGSPLIISAKKDKMPRDEKETEKTETEKTEKTETEKTETEKTIERLEAQGQSEGRGTLTAVGQIMTKKNPTQASVSDLFKGDETSDAAQLDLGKTQMFYFTIALVLAYGAQLGSLFLDDQTLASLPDLSTGMAALLGISHAGYLANKATPS